MSSVNKNIKVADWYINQYKDDTTAQEFLDDKITFEDVIDCIENDPGNFYQLLGCGDSVIRERIFTAVAGILHKPYQMVYDKWLDNDAPSILESQSLVINQSKIKSEIIKALDSLYKTNDHEVTYMVPLGSYGRNNWAVVLAWMDYDNNDNWQVYGKVAYQPYNSVMQEYDIDWNMPEYNGEINDTEVSITPSSKSISANQLIEYWMWIYNNILKNEVEESTMKNNRVKLTEEKRSQIIENLVIDYLMEGKTLQEAMVLAEDTITPEMIDNLEQTPAYRKLKKDIEYYFKAVDGIEGYRDGDFKDGPIEALQGEADFCQETADFLGSLRFKGFKPEKQKELMNDTVEDMEYLDRSALRLTNLLKKQDDSLYLKPDGSVNVNTNQKPGDYARRALRKIRDLFARLGQEWAYDPDFDYKSLPDIDYKNYVLDSKDWKKGLRNVVHTAMTEGITDKQILLNMGNDLKLNESQKKYYNQYVYYILD